MILHIREVFDEKRLKVEVAQIDFFFQKNKLFPVHFYSQKNAFVVRMIFYKKGKKKKNLFEKMGIV